MSIEKVLLVTHAKFWLENRGDLVRIANLYRFFVALGFSVQIFFVGQFEDKDQDIIQSNYENLKIFTRKDGYLPQKKKSAIRNFSQKLARRFLKYNKTNRFWRYVEPQVKDFRSQEQLEFFKEVCLDVQPDYIFVESLRLAYLIQGSRSVLPEYTSTVIDNMDVMHQRCQIFHEFGEKHWVNITEREEAQTLDLFDVVIAIQNRDSAVFRKMLPGKQVITVYHATEITSHPVNFEFPVRLAYIGTKNPHNRYAIENFLKTTWPMLYARFDDQVVLNIIGSVCDALNTSSLPDGANLLGFVEDLETAYRNTDIVINPVCFGGGLKIKNVEALCNGKALVTTTIGAEGIEHGIGDAFHVCDTPVTAIKTLTKLIEDPSFRQVQSTKALAFARENFSQETAYKELSQLLNRDKHSDLSENRQRDEVSSISPPEVIFG